ncbi:hypothetical protein [Streptomyces sp. Root369]|uniref:hypothetical protein n=1 Tax=Streptomyces sp. Root369 TaxID=1736523 RepID=UPI00070EC08D|nr:hypothetical protein [Streptomyces sp. Root369]KQW06972.1 hypothetical protein ASD08_05150 [Streptomyces sp. Root369]
MATGTNTSYWDAYTFDAIGNRITQTQHATASGLDTTQDVTRTYGYGKLVTGNGTSQSALVQPHTLTALTSAKGVSATGTQAYVFDAAGNTTTRPGATQDQSLTWTAEEKLDTATAEGSATQYVYDAGGNRILQHSSTGTTLYLGETEVMTDGSGTPVNAVRTYGQAGAPTVVRTTNGSSTGHKLSCLLTDQLGTASPAFARVDVTGPWGDDTNLDVVLERRPRYSVDEAREFLRGYSWITVCPDELCRRLGGVSGLAASGAFCRVIPLAAGGAVLQSTETLTGFSDDAMRDVFRVLAPVLPAGLPRFDPAHPEVRYVPEDASAM